VVKEKINEKTIKKQKGKMINKCIVCKTRIGHQQGGKWGFYVCNQCYNESQRIWR